MWVFSPDLVLKSFDFLNMIHLIFDALKKLYFGRKKNVKEQHDQI